MAKKTKDKADLVVVPEQKVEEMSKDIKTFGKKVESFLTIKSPEDYEKTTKFIVEVKARINRVKEVLEFFTKPHQEARKRALDEMKKIEALFAPSLKSYEEMEYSLKGAMSAWQREQDRLARIEEDRLRLAREKKEAKTGNIDPTPLPTIPRQEATVATDAGKATAKKVWKFEVVEVDTLFKDKQFLGQLHTLAVEKGLHETILRNMVKAGVREISGVRVYEDYDISVSA